VDGFFFEVDKFLTIFFGAGRVRSSLFVRAGLLRTSGQREHKQQSEQRDSESNFHAMEPQ